MRIYIIIFTKYMKLLTYYLNVHRIYQISSVYEHKDQAPTTASETILKPF